MSVALQQFDLAIYSLIHALTNPLLDWGSSILSTVTWAGACWWVLAAILWIRGHRYLAAQLTIVLIISSIEAEALKHIFHRLRPAASMPDSVRMMIPDILTNKSSFPSGHTLLAAAASVLLLMNVRNWRTWSLLAVAFLVGYARVYEGMHWPTDVIGGFFLGATTAITVAWLAKPLARHSLFAGRESHVSKSAVILHGVSKR